MAVKAGRLVDGSVGSAHELALQHLDGGYSGTALAAIQREWTDRDQLQRAGNARGGVAARMQAELPRARTADEA